jgi:hypothetical protein
LWAKAPKLPRSAPVPELNRQAGEQAPVEPPLPSVRPYSEDGPPQPSPEAPTPEEKPEPEKRRPPDPRALEIPAAAMPGEETACRERLKILGVEFEDRKAEHDTDVGCSIPYPVVVKTLGKAVEIKPAAELNCRMAEAAARFMAEIVQPAAKAELGAEVKSVNQASAYICRPRHNGGKISEHAFGNALDIAAFILSDGTRVEIGAATPQKQVKFLDHVRKAACGPFKTVLGPGADADHARHLHFDLEPRRNGGTFCQ